MSEHYEVHRTRAGHHIVFVGGNGEPVAHGEPLSSANDACKAIKAIARAHSPQRRVEMTPTLDGVRVWWGLGETPFLTIPVEWVDGRKPGVAARALAKVMGPPKTLRDHAAVAVTIDEPIRNGDDHDA